MKTTDLPDSADPATLAARAVVDYDVISDRRLGEDGFLALRRMQLRTVRADGSRSAPFLCDYVERDRGLDAVVVGLYAHPDGEGPPHAASVQVLLRRGLRPPLTFGRDHRSLPLREAHRYLFLTEVVAGLIEPGDEGEAGIRRRAAEEAWEEAGFHLSPDAFTRLGPAVFPSPGLCPERMHLFVARVDPAACHPHPPVGDGSPMEEGSSQAFVPLLAAIDLCERGEIEDAKTELLLRRLLHRLRAAGG